MCNARFAFVVLCVLVNVSLCSEVLKFPPGFLFGAATSAYQVEGAWNVSGKTESIWDRFTHTSPQYIADGSNGDEACDSYHSWSRDVEMAASLGLDFYRFSISWSRLLPNGFANKISEDGKRYYNELIDGLLAKDIKPMATLYHFDLPQKLHDLGGWTNPLIADWFEDYARVAFTLFGDRVDTWITINEPLIACYVVYNMGLSINFVDSDIAPYTCSKHILISHARAWRLYDEEFRWKYGGRISIANQIIWTEAKTGADEESAEIARQYTASLFSHPIYSKQGGWPPLIEKIMAEKSEREGYTVSRLPPFTKEERKLVKGTFDFYGLNYYTSRVARKASPEETLGPFLFSSIPELGIVVESRPEWGQSDLDWFFSYPAGFRKLLNWIKKEYGDVEIVITENGFANQKRDLDDYDRVNYLTDHLEQILFAIKDGVKVTMYTVWSLMDNFEWPSGFTMKFGLYDVDFSSPLRTRTARLSAQFYAGIIKTKRLHRNIKDEH